MLQHAKGAGVLLAMESNSTSASLHDSMTDTMGRILEEFLISKRFYIMNEESVNTTFRNRRGTSKVHLTIISNQLLRTVVEWEISEQESCSDHSIIKYAIGQGTSHRKIVNFQDVRYVVKIENYANLQGNLIQLAKKEFYKSDKEETFEDLDSTLCTLTSEDMAFEKTIEEFHIVLKMACNKTFRT